MLCKETVCTISGMNKPQLCAKSSAQEATIQALGNCDSSEPHETTTEYNIAVEPEDTELGN